MPDAATGASACEVSPTDGHDVYRTSTPFAFQVTVSLLQHYISSFAWPVDPVVAVDDVGPRMVRARLQGQCASLCPSFAVQSAKAG